MQHKIDMLALDNNRVALLCMHQYAATDWRGNVYGTDREAFFLDSDLLRRLRDPRHRLGHRRLRHLHRRCRIFTH